jgi:hypothetical protein
MSDSATPGWYHAEGDPPNTERYWDGAAWTDGPRPIGGLSDETPQPETPSFDMPSMDDPSPAPGGFSSVTPGTSDLPGAAPGGFSSVTPTPDTPPPGSFVPPNMPVMGSTPAGGFGAPPVGGGPPAFPGAPVGGVGAMYTESSQATVALVLSILGAFLCCVTAPIGMYFGYAEKKGIDEGRRDPANRGQAVAALVIGGIVTALYILFFGFIVIAAFAGA